MNNLEKVQLIKEHRKITLKNDSPELQKKKIKFLNWLLGKNFDLQVLEMYKADNENGAIYGHKNIPQYHHEFKFANTRTQIGTELRAEVDKLDFEKAINLICEISLSLIKHKIHFAIFYALGQKSPHIIIYDWSDLEELNPFQRMKLRAKFWRKIIPFRLHLLDQALFDDDHLVPLEFAPHWKYGTPFDLVLEYNPKFQRIISKAPKQKLNKSKEKNAKLIS